MPGLTINSIRAMENAQSNNTLQTKWYHYLLIFLAGVFLTNILPHFINGITGKSFPTPFANPPGKGLSSPTLNVLWASINFLVGFSILFFVKIRERNKLIWIALFFGIIFMSFYLASYFGSLAV
ncbi:hypothetical protein CNR22_19700 [Sphingobacteriaceae bacterium]|nr:hypothetical protein CNR22_19700 [Sphingobacteriaceae bacterium]